MTGAFDLAMADAKLVGNSGGDSAGVVAGAGDVDGDTTPDLFVGAPQSRDVGITGAVFVIRGPVSGTLALSTADAEYVGLNYQAKVGSALAGVGDVDADGRDDLLVGVPTVDVPAIGDDVGAAYLLLGGSIL